MAMRIAGLPIVVALAVALGVAGCNTRQRIAGGGAAMTAIGVALTYSNDPREEEDVGTSGKVGITLLLVGIVTMFVAAALDETANEPKPIEIKATNPHGDPAEVQQMERAAAVTEKTKRDQAWELTKAAQAAARENDCAKVTELSAQVGALDPDLYAEVFMKDVAVQRCLMPAAPPTDAPALPPPAVPEPAPGN